MQDWGGGRIGESTSCWFCSETWAHLWPPPIQLPTHSKFLNTKLETGHCSNRSAKKWVGVILEHKGCVWQLYRLATASLSWPASMAFERRVPGSENKAVQIRVVGRGT